MTAALRWHLGVVEMYAGSDEQSIEELSKLGTMKGVDPLLAARAKNAIGYVMLLGGRLDDADQWFRQSSSVAPILPNPRINSGYVLLIKGQYHEAERHFRSLLTGRDVVSAARDRVLVRLALGLSLDSAGKVESATDEYDSVLRETRGTGAVEVEGALQPVLIRVRLAREVYLRNRDYYGLEVLGAVVLGSACELLCANSNRTALFAELKESINSDVRWIYAVAPPRPELLRHQSGLLKRILPRGEEPCGCRGEVKGPTTRTRAVSRVLVSEP